MDKTKTLSVQEIELLTRLEFEGKNIYTRTDITSFCNNNKKAGYLIKKLLEKKRLKKIIKNVYLYVPIKAPKGVWGANEYLIAKALVRGARYYIGYPTVFSSYGFTTQIAQLVCIVNEKYSMRKVIFGIAYKLIKVLPNKIYGLEKRKISNEEVVFPQKERALIDIFEFYDTRKAYTILQNQLSKIDINFFVKLVAQYPVQIIKRRIGYFLEKLKIDKKLLNTIKIEMNGYSPLYNNRSKKGRIDKKWRIFING